MTDAVNMLDLRRVAVVGATGPTGRCLVEELGRRGRATCAVSRSAERLARCFPESTVDRVVADALDGDALARAVEGCDLVVDCIGLPADRMEDHPATARGVVAAARATGARCAQVSSFWGFLPLVGDGRLDESHPRTGGNAYVRARRSAEDVFLQAGGAVAHLPDFFGPRVHASILQRALEEAAAGKPIRCMGGADVTREHVFVPDAMRLFADLVEREDAYGRGWIFPGSGPIAMRQVGEIAAQHLRRPVPVRGAPSWLLKALALVNADLRAFRPMLDHYVGPIAFDASRLAGLLGPLETTSYEAAIPRTLARLAA